MDHSEDGSSTIAQILDEFLDREANGDKPSIQEYVSRYPQWAKEIQEALVALRVLHDARQTTPIHRPLPKSIGRYRVEKLLGQGGFGLVYLAKDEQLNRPVAIKVPHTRRLDRLDHLESYLAEARTVARLDHPGIVPVYDVGSTEEYPCFIVSRYIDGTDLRHRPIDSLRDIRDIVTIIAAVADALHYSHQQGFVHRDVKPANILLDQNTQPWLVDFGLAFHEDWTDQPQRSGTPAYMSPEQARAEGHRVDARTDIFSLGVVLYELLAGHQPFRGSTTQQILEQVIRCDPPPLRHSKPSIPRELDRICSRAMGKLASQRYRTALELSNDLQGVLRLQSSPKSGTPAWQLGNSDIFQVSIVPKGLRAFDQHDADFFLDLLPGPHDLDGLPASLRFWKRLVEEEDFISAIPVGLIYGPSGSGKSSLVRAGLIPRLNDRVQSLYLVASPEETEMRLQRGLYGLFPWLDSDLTLPQIFASLRRGHPSLRNKKILIVIDQFEQWLHAHPDLADSEIVRAMRQCDGAKLQVIVLVRDDFWMAATRLMRELEIQAVEGRNAAAVDLFPIRHAEKVLTAFGRAYGCLPSERRDMQRPQLDFLQQSVQGLAEEGKVICVRLALFAEMMKAREWIPSTLKQVGGTHGIGVTFLEESFSSNAANPEYRLHEEGIRAVLQALLPESGTQIKGCMKSRLELLVASGYAHRTQDFDRLLEILDREVRLITPCEPDLAYLRDPNRPLHHSKAEVDTRQVATSQPYRAGYYQLTHDYLIPALRDWLTIKQKENRSGRARLRLMETTHDWTDRAENRFLPSWWDYLQIRWFTHCDLWTAPQRKMMKRAGQVHARRTAFIASTLMGLLVFSFWIYHRVSQQQEWTRFEGLVGRLISADPSQIPEIARALDTDRLLADQLLDPLMETDLDTPQAKRAQLHARIAQLPHRHELVPVLLRELLEGNLAYAPAICQQMQGYDAQVLPELRETLRQSYQPKVARFRAALGLASLQYSSDPKDWTQDEVSLIVEQLLQSNGEYQRMLRELLYPIRNLLLTDLKRWFTDPNAPDSMRLSAANAFADYAASDFSLLAELVTYANASQFEVLSPLFPSPLPAELRTGFLRACEPSSIDQSEGTKQVSASQRRVNAALVLLLHGDRSGLYKLVLPLEDQGSITQFVSEARSKGVRSELLLQALAEYNMLDDPQADRIRYLLLMTLGQFEWSELGLQPRERLVQQMLTWSRIDPNPQIREVVHQLLERWDQQVPSSPTSPKSPFAPRK